MKQPAKVAIVIAGLLFAGAVKMPVEIAITRDLRTVKLLPEPLSIGVRERIGQTSFAVALGGLRTLVATFLHLRAYTAFTEHRWADVEDGFGTIVDLAPNTGYYWETGAWHLAYNAASFYLSDIDDPAIVETPPLRRREMWRASIRKGRSFIERGIRNNPDDWRLQNYLGQILTDPFRFNAFPDRVAAFTAAAAAYDAAARTGKAPAFVARARFLALARVPGRETEALALGEGLYRAGRANRVPALLALLFILKMHADPSQDGVALASTLFTSDERAYSALSAIWLEKDNFYPVHGIAPVLQALEKKLAVAPNRSVFNR